MSFIDIYFCSGQNIFLDNFRYKRLISILSVKNKTFKYLPKKIQINY